MEDNLQHGRQRKVPKALGIFLRCFSATARKEQEQLVHDHVDNNTEEIIRRRSRVASTTAVDEKPLGKIADAFKELADIVISENVVEVAAFSRACAFVAPLFGSIGFHFKFIEMDYLTKVNDIAEASKSFKTLQSMVDHDVQTNSVRIQGSHSRNLLKIKRGLEFLKVLFEQVLLTEGNSMRDAVSKAYTQIFNSYHGWALRKAVSVRLNYIPTKQQLYRKLGEDGKYSIIFATISLYMYLRLTTLTIVVMMLTIFLLFFNVLH
ncbi:accelerated cell death 11-like isoform X1 [Vicia villosa]|uniref:accelerated cell death 11-like isoform X1 n=1 Tax=Vicia villosa TaxID=3911 RepID=UPI00273CADF0|nr:accelerated cell death 11-like isoform X1 [Vicia villosa]